MRVPPVIVALVLIGAGACASGDDDASEDPPPIAVLERAFREFQAAYDSGDGERAWELLSERCRDAITREAFVRGATGWADFAGPRTITNVRAELSTIASPEVRATVTWTVVEDPAGGTSSSDWVAEDNAWHHDTC